MAFKLFGGRENKNRGSVLAASADVRNGRVGPGETTLLKAGDPNPPAAPPAPEVDPLAEFKKSGAYGRLLAIGAISKECKLLNAYFRAQVVRNDGTYAINRVFKIHEPFNNLRVLLTDWDKSSQSDQLSDWGRIHGSQMWDRYPLVRSNEAEYKTNENIW
jgi:hypothetical protein